MAIALLTTGIFSCQKDKSGVNNASTISGKSLTGNDISPTVKSVPYVWKINLFMLNGNDMTTQFADYKFDIRAPQLMTGDYIIAVVSGSNIYYGKWNRATYGEVIINFGSDVPSPLSLLNDTWTLTNNQQYDIAMQTSTKTMSFHTDGETWPPGN